MHHHVYVKSYEVLLISSGLGNTAYYQEEICSEVLLVTHFGSKSFDLPCTTSSVVGKLADSVPIPSQTLRTLYKKSRQHSNRKISHFTLLQWFICLVFYCLVL